MRLGIISFVTVQTFRDMLARRPFQPVRLTTSSRQTYDIRHPEIAFLTRSDIFIGVDVGDDGIPAEFRIVSLLHVTCIEPIVQAA
jgi:hypothetical protein